MNKMFRDYELRIVFRSGLLRREAAWVGEPFYADSEIWSAEID
jgi:hypothetical protein